MCEDVKYSSAIFSRKMEFSQKSTEVNWTFILLQIGTEKWLILMNLKFEI